jgi:hypothetical protein
LAVAWSSTLFLRRPDLDSQLIDSRRAPMLHGWSSATAGNEQEVRDEPYRFRYDLGGRAAGRIADDRGGPGLAGGA